MNDDFKAVIYSLIDPLTKEVKYIGVTATNWDRQTYKSAVIYRIDNHMICENNNPEKYKWINYLKSLNLMPEYKILATCHCDLGIYVERKEIYKYLKRGCVLFNMKLIKPELCKNEKLEAFSNGFKYWIDKYDNEVFLTYYLHKKQRTYLTTNI